MQPNVSEVHKELKIFTRLKRKYDTYLFVHPEITYEIGSLDGTDSISISKLFNTKILAFEPTEESFKKVQKNLNTVKGKSYQFALSDYCGYSEFFVNDPLKTITTWADGNQGANSLLKNNKNYPIETYFQNSTKVEVRAIKCLIENGFAKPSFIWMDVQGSELSVLKGMGDYLHEVKFIYCELSLFQLYENQPYAKEIIEYLNNFGFQWVGNLTFGTFQFDACFVKPQKNILKAKAINALMLRLYNTKNQIYVARTPKQYLRMLPRIFLDFAKRL